MEIQSSTTTDLENAVVQAEKTMEENAAAVGASTENVASMDVEAEAEVTGEEEKKEEGEVVIIDAELMAAAEKFFAEAEEKDEDEEEENEEEKMEIEDENVEEENKSKKKKVKQTSKYFGVSHIGKRWRAMFGGKYIGMTDTELEAAKWVNRVAVQNGFAPKNQIPKHQLKKIKNDLPSTSVTKKIVKKTKRAKKVVKRRRK